MKSDTMRFYNSDDLDLFQFAKNWKKYFANKISNHIQGDVLEVGAGIGSNTKYLIESNPNIKSWTCIEPEKIFIPRIRENLKNLNINFTVKNSTIEGISELFDTIIYLDVLEHIDDTKKEFIEINKRLKLGGKLIILVPAYNFLYNEFDRHVGHIKRYNKKVLKQEIKYNKVKIFYLDSMGFFASFFNKILLKKHLPSKKNILFWDKILIRMSIITDKLIFNRFGKSLIGIFTK